MIDDIDSDGNVGAPNATTQPTDDGDRAGLSRRRLLAATGAVAAGSLAGCLGGGGDGGSGGGSQVQNDVDGIEVTEVSGEVAQGTYAITVSLKNTGGEETSVLDFNYRVTLYDAEGSEIPTMGSVAANRDGFYDDDTGTVELRPQMEADPSSVADFELRITCDDGPYCE